MNMHSVFLMTTALVTVILLTGVCGAEGEDNADNFIQVINPVTIGADRLPAQRIPVGLPGDYKPCIARLPSGELLLVMFYPHHLEDGRYQEDIILYRSDDGGVTWPERQVLDLLGREPYLTVLKDATVFITVHFLIQDWRNKDGYVHSYVHRSTDGGHTWTTTPIVAEDLPDAPPKTSVVTSRKLLERDDGVLLLGVSAKVGHYVWQSTDKGETWDKSRRVAHPTDEDREQFAGFNEGVLWQTQSGQVFLVKRVGSSNYPPLDERPIPTGSDQVHRMLLFESTDGGYTWGNASNFSDYGEMYPSILRLQDGRLLFTFTVRALKVPLGVQAALGYEDEAGLHFDFGHDRLILDPKTAEDMPSGGGFGPTVQLEDGTLVTSYSYRDAQDQTHAEVVRWRLPSSSD